MGGRRKLGDEDAASKIDFSRPIRFFDKELKPHLSEVRVPGDEVWYIHLEIQRKKEEHFCPTCCEVDYIDASSPIPARMQRMPVHWCILSTGSCSWKRKHDYLSS